MGETLAQLMNTVMLTGYMFKSAEERYRLRTALGDDTAGPVVDAQQQGQQGQGQQQQREQRQQQGQQQQAGAAAGGGGMASILDEEQYAPGVQKSRVKGEVLLWHKEKGLEEMPAAAYIELLEAEVLRLRRAAEAPKPPRGAPRLPPAAAWGLDPFDAAAAAGSDDRPLPQLHDARRAGQALALRPAEDRNALLEFIRALEPTTVGELTGCATAETTAAMDAFVERLLGLGGGADRDALRRVASETKASEMRQLLFWLMVVGWKLRALEMQIELDRSFD
jgi:hypothetical protein